MNDQDIEQQTAGLVATDKGKDEAITSNTNNSSFPISASASKLSSRVQEMKEYHRSHWIFGLGYSFALLAIVALVWSADEQSTGVHHGLYFMASLLLCASISYCYILERYRPGHIFHRLSRTVDRGATAESIWPIETALLQARQSLALVLVMTAGLTLFYLVFCIGHIHCGPQYPDHDHHTFDPSKNMLDEKRKATLKSFLPESLPEHWYDGSLHPNHGVMHTASMVLIDQDKKVLFSGMEPGRSGGDVALVAEWKKRGSERRQQRLLDEDDEAEDTTTTATTAQALGSTGGSSSLGLGGQTSTLSLGEGGRPSSTGLGGSTGAFGNAPAVAENSEEVTGFHEGAATGLQNQQSSNVGVDMASSSSELTANAESPGASESTGTVGDNGGDGGMANSAAVSAPNSESSATVDMSTHQKVSNEEHEQHSDPVPARQDTIPASDPSFLASVSLLNQEVFEEPYCFMSISSTEACFMTSTPDMKVPTLVCTDGEQVRRVKVAKLEEENTMRAYQCAVVEYDEDAPKVWLLLSNGVHAVEKEHWFSRYSEGFHVEYSYMSFDTKLMRQIKSTSFTLEHLHGPAGTYCGEPDRYFTLAVGFSGVCVVFLSTLFYVLEQGMISMYYVILLDILVIGYGWDKLWADVACTTIGWLLVICSKLGARLQLRPTWSQPLVSPTYQMGLVAVFLGGCLTLSIMAGDAQFAFIVLTLLPLTTMAIWTADVFPFVFALTGAVLGAITSVALLWEGRDPGSAVGSLGIFIACIAMAPRLARNLPVYRMRMQAILRKCLFGCASNLEEEKEQSTGY